MSFDLHFCSPQAGRIDFESVAAWAEQRGPFIRNPHQLWYRNEDTGVYFSIDFEPEEPKTPDDSPIPAGYFDSGLSFNLNFNRPSFFGYEAMPFVAELAGRFGLWVFNPQSDQTEIAREVETSRLIESWLDHNQRAISTLMQEEPSFSDPFHMPVERSIQLWRFDRAKEKLKQICGEEIFVPRLVPIHRKGSKSVGRAFTCTESVPTVVPESEWVFVVPAKNGLFRPKKKSEVGVISSETFQELLRQQIEPFDFPDTRLQVIRPQSVRKVGRLLASLDRMLNRAEFEILSKDSFVDIELPNKT